MLRATRALPILGLCLAAARPGVAESGGPWAGLWVTDEGVLTLEQKGSAVTGTYGRGGEVEGVASGKTLEGTYQEGDASGRVELEMQEGNGHFRGKRTLPGGDSRTWRGWKQDPQAESKSAADFSGHWLTSIGAMVLQKKGSSVEGPWGHEGWGKVAGTAKGRRMTGRLEKPSWRGEVWLETTPDGKRIFGSTDERPPTAVLGVRLEGFSREPRLAAGEIAQGIASNGMLYFARPPEGWKPGAPVDVIVLLHGSNWTTKGMVWVTAKTWPDLGRKFMIVGVQGDQWAPLSEGDDHRFNYHYVNWMGRSTYKGIPYTERDGPQLVADVLAELTKKHAWKRVLLGGHSQGGFMAYAMHMHFPEQLAGTFPMAGDLLIQAEPDVFEDEKLKAAQRSRPMAIVHGKQDNVVPHARALYVRDRFEGTGFPLTTLIDPEVGHPYDFLPVGDAVRWLDALTATKPEALVEFGNDAAKRGRWGDVGAALVRARELKVEKSLASAAKAYDAAAADGVARFGPLLGKGAPGEWADEFFAWKRQFGRAPAAAATMAAYEKLRAKHDPEADALVAEARKALRGGNRAEGRAKYEQVVSSCFVSGMYPIARRWLAEAD